MDNFMQTTGLRRRILVVDDEEINREILGQILSGSYEVSYAENGKQAYEMLTRRDLQFSLMLLDLLMPEMDGFELLERIQESEELHSVPVIVMTSEKDAEVQSIRLGASDFITKPYDMPEVILARCERIIELYEGNSLIRSAEKDRLTGLYSKEFFFEYIRQFETYNGEREMDAVVLNIEHFHMINEMYGRSVGDDVLKRTGLSLTRLFDPKSCIACRPDADTFYLYGVHREEYEEVFAELQEELAQLSQSPRIRFRIGIYPNVDKEIPAEIWFDHAKMACDRIRGDYTRQLSFYSKELNEHDLFHERLINDIDEAIERRDLIVYFQPKYAIQGVEPRLRSAEALIRWKHPELGMISPGEFIPLFESNGLIQKLDRYVWQEAVAQIRRWKEEFGISVPVSVNVSRVDIYDPKLEENLLELLKKNGISTEDLMLEITESAYSENSEGLIRVVNALRDNGFRIELDDFGSGYSSLNMLTTIPIDVLKMDMLFIRNMHKSVKNQKLVELVIDIARFLGVPVIAEGVEDEAQLITLKDIGCDVIQGYYFSKPVPPEEFVPFIEEELRKREME